MPEENEYRDKHLEARFAHIDASIQSINDTMNDLKTQFVDLGKEVRKENETTRREVKAENRATRWWIVGTAITVLIGFAAIAVTIFFGFSQLQTSWIQSAFSLDGKTIAK